LSIGQLVAGRFRIHGFLGSGGMGEVYEAWDFELSERIALKTIRSQIASLSSVIDRFKQEVREARGISHINVCRVYEVFSHQQATGEHIWFLTMELLEGRTITETLRRHGPLKPQVAFDLVEQMVAGLAAAHQHGIVHRDFKSSNVMLVNTGSGKIRAVVTDFGLALKILAGQHISPGESKVGTLLYMAPEQAHGGDVGFAADQYALGVVMCEMLTGEYPSRPLVAGKVLLPSNHHLNSCWEAAIRRCLELRPEDRFPDIRDVVLALSPSKKSKVLWIAVTAVLISLLLGVGILEQLRRSNIQLQEVAQLTPSTDYSGQPSISRDGTLVAYSSDRAEAGNTDIWVQHVPSGSPVRLTKNSAEDVDASISPDGSSIAFRSQRNGGGIYLVDVGGRGERLLVAGGRDPRFSPDGRSIAYWVGDPDVTIPNAEIFVLSLANGSSVQLAVDFKDARFPFWTPDGRYILFTGCRTGDQALTACSEWWMTNPDGSRIQNTTALNLLRSKKVYPVEGIGGWLGDSAIFSATHGGATSIWRLRIPPTHLAATGVPQPVTAGSGRLIDELSVADKGEVAFSHLSVGVHVWRIDEFSNPKAPARKITQDAAYDFSPFISHNGRWLVFSRGVGTHHDIWIKDIATGRESLLPESTDDKTSPIVDDSGRTVVFAARNDQGRSSLVVASVGKPTEVLCVACSRATGWFKGSQGVFHEEGLPSVIKLSQLGTRSTETVLEAKGVSLGQASWSPENQYLLFTASSRGGAKRVYAVRFPETTELATSKWIPITGKTILADRGRWSGDGRTIFYISTRDGSPCLWGQRFDPRAGKLRGTAFPVLHLHNPRITPEIIAPERFQISASGKSLYFNLGEASATIWLGTLKQAGLFDFLREPR
jgi:serine/threonine protein kinase